MSIVWIGDYKRRVTHNTYARSHSLFLQIAAETLSQTEEGNIAGVQEARRTRRAAVEMEVVVVVLQLQHYQLTDAEAVYSAKSPQAGDYGPGLRTPLSPSFTSRFVSKSGKG